jgi:hypothetical protein
MNNNKKTRGTNATKKQRQICIGGVKKKSLLLNLFEKKKLKRFYYIPCTNLRKPFSLTLV